MEDDLMEPIESELDFEAMEDDAGAFDEELEAPFDFEDSDYAGEDEDGDEWEGLASALDAYLNADDEEDAFEEGLAGDYEEELESRIVDRIGGMLGQVFAPLAEQQALQQLGGHAAAEYLSDLTPEERLAVAQIPSLARAIRDAVGGRSYGRAPRSEGAYMPEAPYLGGELQREIERAYPAYADAFGVTKAQFTKMVLSKQGGY
ncbi:MAG: hypothetical protein ACO1SV_00800 [Fimbriimonas sp.]